VAAPAIESPAALLRESSVAHPNVQLHFTPTYSSWLNQVEIWFSKIERDVIARGVFTSVKDLARKLRRYINAYSANAKPIQWKYSDPVGPKYSTDLRKRVSTAVSSLRRQVFYDGASTCATPSIAPDF
jgi:hypothetical protein